MVFACCFLWDYNFSFEMICFSTGGSEIAKSANIFRSIIISASFNPLMNLLYGIPSDRRKALILVVQSLLFCLFLCFRPAKAYSPACIVASFAVLTSRLLAPRYPFAWESIFLCFLFFTRLFFTLTILYFKECFHLFSQLSAQNLRFLLASNSAFTLFYLQM